MAGRTDDPRPERARHWLTRIAIGLLASTILAVILIAAGAFDPKPFGSLLQTDHPDRRVLTDGGEALYRQTPPWPPATPPGRYSVRLAAAYEAGETDSAYGLSMGDGDNQVVIAISPLGYVALRAESAGDTPNYLIPWQTWPHVRTGTAENEIWVDVAQDGPDTLATVRLNRELLWEGKLDGATADIALWQATFGTPVTVDFRSLEWFADP